VATWIQQHKILVFMICLAATVFVLCKLFPPFEEKIVKRILAGISIVLVALTYFTVVALTAIMFKLLRRRLLPDFRKDNPSSYWTGREKTDPTLDYLKRQF
jgi:hypothetical protein